jgi:hypothetical protein
MNDSWPYPLPETALSEFCHPADWHVFANPARGDSEILACNGYLALRAHRGAWLDREIPAAGKDFMERFLKIPWGRYVKIRDDAWRPLSDMRSKLEFHGRIDPWLRGRPAPSPVWLVDEFRVRLTWLQLIARLPRCEVATGQATDACPVFFRFSGGRGAILPDARMGAPSYTIFKAAEDIFTGERQERRQGPIMRLTQPGVNWPPPECTD